MLSGVDEISLLIKTSTFAKGGSNVGDSGGPLFQTDDRGRHILVGIYSHYLNNSPNESQNMINIYTDVRAFLDWICKYSGVCPAEETSEEQLI
ncbi:unnamed protein product [Strongylus vulgaris]|uniref:Peptidase S1 domain-containing protein n=1 Tax=Strongylus vulgaris TaxID=40348 RepID=A0A3P7IS42_STRVU|nr:unnamed protein product [Strongylus vulgaris]